MLIVDDTQEKCVRNYGNAIHPLAFEGDGSDAELRLLADYLATLNDETNVRRIERGVGARSPPLGTERTRVAARDRGFHRP